MTKPNKPDIEALARATADTVRLLEARVAELEGSIGMLEFAVGQLARELWFPPPDRKGRIA